MRGVVASSVLVAVPPNTTMFTDVSVAVSHLGVRGYYTTTLAEIRPHGRES